MGCCALPCRRRVWRQRPWVRLRCAWRWCVVCGANRTQERPPAGARCRTCPGLVLPCGSSRRKGNGASVKSGPLKECAMPALCSNSRQRTLQIQYGSCRLGSSADERRPGICFRLLQRGNAAQPCQMPGRRCIGCLAAQDLSACIRCRDGSRRFAQSGSGPLGRMQKGQLAFCPADMLVYSIIYGTDVLADGGKFCPAFRAVRGRLSACRAKAESEEGF